MHIDDIPTPAGTSGRRCFLSSLWAQILDVNADVSGPMSAWHKFGARYRRYNRIRGHSQAHGPAPWVWAGIGVTNVARARGATPRPPGSGDMQKPRPQIQRESS